MGWGSDSHERCFLTAYWLSCRVACFEIGLENEKCSEKAEGVLMVRFIVWEKCGFCGG